MRWVLVPLPLQRWGSAGHCFSSTTPLGWGISGRAGRGWETHPSSYNTQFGFGRKPQLRSQRSKAGGLPLLLGVPRSAANFRGVTLR